MGHMELTLTQVGKQQKLFSLCDLGQTTPDSFHLYSFLKILPADRIIALGSEQRQEQILHYFFRAQITE